MALTKYRKAYYQRNKDRFKEHARKSNAKRHFERCELLDGIKSETGCCKCGNRDPRVLTFHHVNANSKYATVSSMKRLSLQRLYAEINKCVIMCFNCHAIHELEKGCYALQQKGSNGRRPQWHAKKRRQALVNSIKADQGCIVCGITNPQILVFHHPIPEEKVAGISALVNTSNMATIYTEMAKCDVYCRNHHRIVEWEKRHGVDES